MLLRITKIWWRATLSHKTMIPTLPLPPSFSPSFASFLTKLIFRVWFRSECSISSSFKLITVNYFQVYCIRCLWCMTIDKRTPCKSSWTLDSLTTTIYSIHYLLFIVGNKKKFMLKIFVLFRILHRFIARIKAKTVFNVHCTSNGWKKERNIQFRSKRLIESVIICVCFSLKLSTIKLNSVFFKTQMKNSLYQISTIEIKNNNIWNRNNKMVGLKCMSSSVWFYCILVEQVWNYRFFIKNIGGKRKVRKW